VQAALTVDPDSATRRREDAERHKGRVQLFREESGAAGLSGRDMPTDQTLAAHAKVGARARQYRDSGVFDRDTRMDQFRVAAYLDLLNGIPADARIASGQLASVSGRCSASGEGAGAGNGTPGDMARARQGHPARAVPRVPARNATEAVSRPPAKKTPQRTMTRPTAVRAAAIRAAMRMAVLLAAVLPATALPCPGHVWLTS
jgi:hypothetical protein